MKYFYEYLKLVKNGKPISKEVGQALDRIPEYLNRYMHRQSSLNALAALKHGCRLNLKSTKRRTPSQTGAFAMIPASQMLH